MSSTPAVPPEAPEPCGGPGRSNGEEPDEVGGELVEGAPVEEATTKTKKKKKNKKKKKSKAIAAPEGGALEGGTLAINGDPRRLLDNGALEQTPGPFACVRVKDETVDSLSRRLPNGNGTAMLYVMTRNLQNRSSNFQEKLMVAYEVRVCLQANRARNANQSPWHPARRLCCRRLHTARSSTWTSR
jgi:hypothetical protein